MIDMAHVYAVVPETGPSLHEYVAKNSRAVAARLHCLVSISVASSVVQNNAPNGRVETADFACQLCCHPAQHAG